MDTVLVTCKAKSSQAEALFQLRRYWQSASSSISGLTDGSLRVESLRATTMISVLRETQDVPRRRVARELALAGGRATGLASRITARCGDGRGWTGLAGSGRTATATGRWCAKWSSCGASRNIRRTIAGTSSGGCLRKVTVRRSSGTAETMEIENGRSVAALGPYPSRGDYEHCFTLEGPRGEFVQLTPAAARHIARAIEASRGVAVARREGKRSRSARGARSASMTRMRRKCWRES